MFPDERRKFIRAALTTELWIGQDGIFTRNGERLGDLSLGGAFIESEQIYTVGAVLNLRFKMPGQHNFVTCTSIVRNVRFGGFGVQFLDLSSESRWQIQEFIEKQTGSGAFI